MIITILVFVLIQASIRLIALTVIGGANKAQNIDLIQINLVKRFSFKKILGELFRVSIDNEIEFKTRPRSQNY